MEHPRCRPLVGEDQSGRSASVPVSTECRLRRVMRRSHVHGNHRRQGKLDGGSATGGGACLGKRRPGAQLPEAAFLMASPTVSVLEGNTFIVSDLAGNINATPTDPVGLFAWDTRFLSKWILTIDGIVPNVLSTDDLQYYLAQFFLVPGTGTIYVDSDISIIRRRAAGAGFQEEIIIRNEKPDPTDLQVRLEAGADFADLFEVKDQLPKKGELYQLGRGPRPGLGGFEGT